MFMKYWNYIEIINFVEITETFASKRIETRWHFNRHCSWLMLFKRGKSVIFVQLNCSTCQDVAMQEKQQLESQLTSLMLKLRQRRKQIAEVRCDSKVGPNSCCIYHFLLYYLGLENIRFFSSIQANFYVHCFLYIFPDLCSYHSQNRTLSTTIGI